MSAIVWVAFDFPESVIREYEMGGITQIKMVSKSYRALLNCHINYYKGKTLMDQLLYLICN